MCAQPGSLLFAVRVLTEGYDSARLSKDMQCQVVLSLITFMLFSFEILIVLGIQWNTASYTVRPTE